MIQDATLQWAGGQAASQACCFGWGHCSARLLDWRICPTQSASFCSYLFAYVYWAGIAIGSLAIIMLHHLSGGGWGMMIRRLLEAATRTLPLVAVLFLPLILGMKPLYEWARPELVDA